MEETKSGQSYIGVLFIILVVWLIFGGFGGGGHQTPMMAGGCGQVSNCAIEKQEIIDSARTQYLVEQQAAQTRAEVQAGVNSIYEQNNRLYIQGIQTELFDAKMKIQALESRADSDAKFNALSAQMNAMCCNVNTQLDAIRGTMLTKPNLYGIAATCSGQIIPPITTTTTA